MITASQLQQITGPVCSIDRAEACLPALRSALVVAGAHTVVRAATLLSQLIWETGQLRFLIESEDAARAYEGRSDLGNTTVGDGVLYRGRGFLHLTGRANYRTFGTRIGVDLEAQPDLAAELDIAALVTASYWELHQLNALADVNDRRGVTKRINGAATDEAPSYFLRRERYYWKALEVFGSSALI